MRCNGPGWILTHRMACIDRPTALWNGFGRVHHKPMGQPFQIFLAKFLQPMLGNTWDVWVYTSGVDIDWLCPLLMVWLNPTKNYSLGYFWNDYVLACGGWLCFLLGVVWTRQARKASRRDKEDFHGGRPCGCNWEQATTLHLAIASWLRCSLNPQQALSLPI